MIVFSILVNLLSSCHQKWQGLSLENSYIRMFTDVVPRGKRRKRRVRRKQERKRNIWVELAIHVNHFWIFLHFIQCPSSFALCQQAAAVLRQPVQLKVTCRTAACFQTSGLVSEPRLINLEGAVGHCTRQQYCLGDASHISRDSVVVYFAWKSSKQRYITWSTLRRFFLDAYSETPGST